MGSLRLQGHLHRHQIRGQYVSPPAISQNAQTATVQHRLRTVIPEKRYTFILKDALLPPDESTGREQSTISWECDFELPPQTKPGETHDRSVFIPWDSLNPTYRGKLKKDAGPLDTTKIKRMSIMMRRYVLRRTCVTASSVLNLVSIRLIYVRHPSFFGAQEGDFSLTIKQISALSKVPKTTATIATSALASNPAAFSPHSKNVDNAELERGPTAKNDSREPESFVGADVDKVCDLP